jgi:RND superfamily putative drug exporter
MFDALARLAQGRSRLVVVLAVAFFAVAGAIGSGVADKLEPYGAEDPDTETVQVSGKLERAGHRDVGLIVLIDRPANHRSQAFAERLGNELMKDHDVELVYGYGLSLEQDFVANDGKSSYLTVALKPTDDKRWQEAGERIAESLADEPGVSVGGPALAQAQVNDQVESDLRRAELLAFPLLFLLSLLFIRRLVAAALPQQVGGLAIVGTI